VVYWATGFAFGFGYIGPDSNMFIGYRQFFLSETEGGRLAYFFFEYTFAAASATIIRFVEINSHSFVRSIDRSMRRFFRHRHHHRLCSSSSLSLSLLLVSSHSCSSFRCIHSLTLGG